jgi:hypothetical protein
MLHTSRRFWRFAVELTCRHLINVRYSAFQRVLFLSAARVQEKGHQLAAVPPGGGAPRDCAVLAGARVLLYAHREHIRPGAVNSARHRSRSGGGDHCHAGRSHHPLPARCALQFGSKSYAHPCPAPACCTRRLDTICSCVDSVRMRHAFVYCSMMQGVHSHAGGELDRVMADFDARGLRGCAGCIDGCYLPIPPPSGMDGMRYYCFKSES